MGSEYTLLKLSVLDALQATTYKEMRSILEKAVTDHRRSQYWQEDVITSGLASSDEFFYDTYMGSNPEVLRIQENAKSKI